VVLGDGGDEGGELERGEAGGRVDVVVRRVAVVVLVGVWLRCGGGALGFLHRGERESERERQRVWGTLLALAGRDFEERTGVFSGIPL